MTAPVNLVKAEYARRLPRSRFFGCFANGGLQPVGNVMWRPVPNRADRRADGHKGFRLFRTTTPRGGTRLDPRHRNNAIMRALKDPAVKALVEDAVA